MIRADAASYLAGQFGTLFADVGLATTDVGGALKEPLDDAYRGLGIAEADLASYTVLAIELGKFLALARYYTVAKAYQAAVAKVDIEADAPDTKKRRSQAAPALAKLLEAVRTEAVPYLSSGAAAFQMATYTLDIYEPRVPYLMGEEE